jgi:hypothetical protein
MQRISTIPRAAAEDFIALLDPVLAAEVTPEPTLVLESLVTPEATAEVTAEATPDAETTPEAKPPTRRNRCPHHLNLKSPPACSLRRGFLCPLLIKHLFWPD